MVLRSVWLSACLLVLTLAVPSHAQNWWASGDGNSETGKLQEAKQKRKVYLNVSFTTPDNDVNAQQEQAQIRRLVTRALGAYKGLELVSNIDQAELAISVVASQTNAGAGGTAGLGNFAVNLDPGVQVPLEVTVTVRGAMQRNGMYRPRVIWNMSSPNVHGEPGPAAVFAVDGFIDQLKKVRGEKK